MTRIAGWLVAMSLGLMGAYWLCMPQGNQISGKVSGIIEYDPTPPTAVMQLRAGGTLPPGAYLQIKQGPGSVCESTATLGADAVAVLRSGKWELWFPYAQVGVNIEGPAHSCNIDIPGAIILMSGVTGIKLKDSSL